MKYQKFLTLVLVLTCLAMLCPSSTAQSTTLTLTVTADTYTVDNNPSNNYGTSAVLPVDSESVEAHALLYFDLSALAGRVVREANLSIEIWSMFGGSTYLVSAADSAWSESSVTWDTEPSAAVISTGIGFTAIGNFTIDVTLIVLAWTNDFIQNHGFILIAPSGYYYFYSKENVGTLKPTLTIVSDPESGIPFVGVLWLIGVLFTIACIYYLSQKSRSYQPKETLLS